MNRAWPFPVQIILKNFRYKIMAVILGFIAWYAVSESINFETQVDDVPISILVREGLTILEQSSESVDIRFKGAEEQIRTLRKDNVKVILDVDPEKVGEEGVTLHIDASDVRVPSGVLPVAIRPAQVTVRVDQEQEKQVVVKSEVIGKLPPGYEVEAITCSPATVILTGPRGELVDMEEIRTLPVELDGRTRTFKVRTGLSPVGQSWNARVTPEFVTVDVRITEYIVSRTFKRVPVHSLQPINGHSTLRVKPATVELTVKGPVDSIEALTRGDIRAFVDCSGLAPEARYDLPIRIHLPGNIVLESAEPSVVNVRIGS